MKPVHILHATLFLRMGGLESIIMDIAKNVNKSLFKISILCLSTYDENYKEAIKQYGVDVYHIQRKGTFDLDFFKKIVNLLKTEKIDILHAHSGCFFNAAVCAKFAGIRSFVYTEHGLPLYDNGLPMNSGLKSRLEDKFAACISNRIFAVSEEIKNNMEIRFKKSVGKVRIVTNGVDTDVFKPMNDNAARLNIKRNLNIPENRKLIGSVGRLVPVKNYVSLINVFSKIAIEKNVNVHLILIGDGVERENLETLVDDHGIRPYVTFAGVRYDIYNILPAFDVFVLPSWTEGTSISLLESQACGIPAIVTNVGGNPSVVNDGVNGFLYEPNDSVKLSDRLLELISDDHLRYRMSMAARTTVEYKYSVHKMTREYETTYKELLDTNPN